MQGGKVVNNVSHPLSSFKNIIVVLTLTLILDTFLKTTSPLPLLFYSSDLTNLVKTK
jgi:hypothetical protein